MNLTKTKICLSLCLAFSLSVAAGATINEYSQRPADPINPDHLHEKVQGYITGQGRAEGAQRALSRYGDTFVNAITAPKGDLHAAAAATMQASSCAFGQMNPRDAKAQIKRIEEIAMSDPRTRAGYIRYLEVVSTLPSDNPDTLEC